MQCKRLYRDSIRVFPALTSAHPCILTPHHLLQRNQTEEKRHQLQPLFGTCGAVLHSPSKKAPKSTSSIPIGRIQRPRCHSLPPTESALNQYELPAWIRRKFWQSTILMLRWRVTATRWFNLCWLAAYPAGAANYNVVSPVCSILFFFWCIMPSVLVYVDIFISLLH